MAAFADRRMSTGSVSSHMRKALQPLCEGREIQGIRGLNGQDEPMEDDGYFAADR